jgi:ATP-dependent DNA ligase
MLVFHGGIGTLAQTVKAGIPHLVVPHGHDQFDNAFRIGQLGLGRGLPQTRYRADRVTDAIRMILDSPQMRGRCPDYAPRVDGDAAVTRACELIEGLSQPRTSLPADLKGPHYLCPSADAICRCRSSFPRSVLWAGMPDAVFSIAPPIEPMLAKLAEGLPEGGPFLYEPKWDGFRAIVFRRGPELYIQSRDLRPLDRYFPELHDALLAGLPSDCVVDGEIVITTPHGLDFDALQLRLHPAASRVAKLAKECPSSFVAFVLLASDGEDLRERPQAERRRRLEQALGGVSPPIHLTPVTRDPAVAADWLLRFEGAGLDGVIVKPEAGIYEPGKRAMIKVKHARTADCVVAGFRWHKNGPGTLIGSLLLGLYDDRARLHHVGVTSSFTLSARNALAAELAPLRERALEDHPWKEWADAAQHAERGDGVPTKRDRGAGAPGVTTTRMPGGQSRWSAGKDLSWEPLRIERVCEVKYDHMQGDRFRHAAVFQRWRPDKPPRECRYDQLEVTTPYELEKVFGAQRT